MNAHKVLTIARQEYLFNLRRPGFLILTAIVPLGGLVVLLLATFASGTAFNTFEQLFGTQEVVGVVDYSGFFTPLLPEYADRYRLYPDEEKGRQALEAGSIGSLIIVPADYLETGNITLIVRTAGFPAIDEEETGELHRFFVAHLVRTLPDVRLRQRLLTPYRATFVRLGEEAGGGEESPFAIVARFVVPFVFSILLIITIFVSSGYLLRSVAEEKSSRVIEIVLSSVTAQELLAGKVIGLGALGLTQVGVWLLSGTVLSGGAGMLLGVVIPLFTRPAILLLATVYYLLGFLLYAVLMASVGALGADVQEAQQLAGIFSLLAAAPFMLSSVFFANPNALLARALSWFPLTAPTAMMLRLPFTQVPAIDIVASIVGIALVTPFVLWGGGKLFRLGLLMYGKRPSIREILRLLRTA